MQRAIPYAEMDKPNGVETGIADPCEPEVRKAPLSSS